jgi:Flp pilus assembly protein TadD
LALGIALVGFAVYANALAGAFVYDDLDNVLRNPWIRAPGTLIEAFTHHMAAFSPRYDTSYYRPLLHVIFACIYGVAGYSPVAYHLALVLLHAATCVAVFVLLHRVTRSEDGQRGTIAASVGALVFAVHPVHAEAVAWISGVVDLSYSLLAVLVLLALTSESPWRRFWLAPCLFLAALLGKEPAVMLVPVFAAFVAARGDLGRDTGRRDFLRTNASLGLAFAVYLAMRVNALGGLMGTGGSRRVAASFGEGLLTALALFGKYVTLLLIPYDLSVLYDYRIATGFADARVWLGMAAVFAVAVLAWRVRRNAAAVLGVALIVLPILPALYVPVLGEGLVGERYLYLPSVGLALLVAQAWNAWAGPEPARARAAVACAALLVAAGAAATFGRNRVWHDNLSLWSDAADKAKSSAAAHEYLGFALLTAGRPAEAVSSFSRALELDPKRRNARTNVASALAAIGRNDEAVLQAESVLAENPRDAETHAILGYALAARGDLARAISEYRLSVELDPRNGSVHNGLAIALARFGDIASATVHFQEAIRLEPQDASFRSNLTALERISPPGAAER